MKCPRCELEFGLSLKAMDQELFSMRLKWEGELVEAKTVGGMIDGTRRLLIAAAKDAGLDYTVMMHSIEWDEKEATFHFLLLPKAQRKPPSPPRKATGSSP